jgi:hypothetical protein
MVRCPRNAAVNSRSRLGLCAADRRRSRRDGVYRGEVTRTRGDDSICGKPSYKTTFSIVNGQFSIVYDLSHHVGVSLVVQPDGTFTGTQAYQNFGHQAQARASGRIIGNVLEAQMEGEGCARSYHLTKG